MRRTRIIAQDQKTGEFAFLDQLVRDGYYKNLWVLPKNYDPPQPVGEAAYIPLKQIFNYAPEVTSTVYEIDLGSMINIFDYTQKIIPSGFISVGTVMIEAV